MLTATSRWDLRHNVRHNTAVDTTDILSSGNDCAFEIRASGAHTATAPVRVIENEVRSCDHAGTIERRSFAARLFIYYVV